MKRTIPIPDCGKGLNKDLLASELELGVWSDANNFRFRKGFAEKWEGVSNRFSTSTVAYWFTDVTVNLSNYVVYLGTAGYVYNGAHTDITRTVKEQTISTLNRLGANSAEVTTSVNHGLSTGDKVTVFGATESGYNEVETTITVTSTTKFTYVTTNAIAANATVVGEYVVTTSSSSTAWTSGDNWSGSVLNGVVVAGDQTNGLFYWSGNTSDKFRKFGFKSYPSRFTDVFKNFIVQLAPTMDGTTYYRRVLWSTAAEPGALPTSFTASATNDAGFLDLSDVGSSLIGGKALGDDYCIYASDSYFLMRYLPGNSAVFSFTKQGDQGIYSKFAVTNTPKGQVFVTPGLDIRIHTGGQSVSIADGRIRNYLRSDLITIRGTSLSDIIAVTNPRKSEVWIMYTPDAVVGVHGRVLAWNWEDDTWSVFTAPTGNVRFAKNGFFEIGLGSENVVAVSTDSNFGVAGGGGLTTSTQAGTWFNTSITGTLERSGLHFDSRDVLKTLHRSRWNIDATAAVTASIFHGSAMWADTTPTYASSVTYTVGTTDYVDARSTNGRFNAIKLTTTAFPFAVRSVDLDVNASGKR